ncbi:Rae1-like protein [Monoraphidium neglectum]|uniref:Rae1-like protein n=1 Tax=Monoraphidium neglectum TaxID=145388 RepID=A0A0D2MGX2_9CHLO|nr:Rae1-like protein [Monoraphidium neglectum]KIY94290.1 Rae1-like protein [Monoraphidium neglectum]|eukprot:XP_013893310.1 Rae1-like protein [Monoraphidium neglectum]
MFGAQAQQGGHNPNKDVQVATPLGDSVSSLAFSPRANLLVATCWDNNVYCWDIQPNGTANPKASTTHTQPVLCSAWNADGTGVFTGGCDKMVKLWNLATNQSQQVAAHDAPVRHCAFIPELNMLVTGGWDKTLRYWDLRQPQPAFTYTLSERLYALDVKHPLLVAATADRQLFVFNLQPSFKLHASAWLARPLLCAAEPAAAIQDGGQPTQVADARGGWPRG